MTSKSLKHIVFISSVAAFYSFSFSQTYAGYGSSWIGLQSPDQAAIASSNLIPVVASDCPADPDMQAGWKVFDNSATGTNDALMFDWTHNYGGWHAANIAGTNWALVQAPVTDQNCKLVYWIKGEAGGEEWAFTLNLGFANSLAATAIWPPNIPAVTTSWRKIVIPISSFGSMPAGVNGVISIQTGNSHSAMHAKYYIDNVYFTTGNTSVRNLSFSSFRHSDVLSPSQPLDFSAYDLAGRKIMLPFHQNKSMRTTGFYLISNDLTSTLPIMNFVK